MYQIKKIVEAGCKGIVSDNSAIADLVTRGEREIYLVSDVECPKYSFLLILSNLHRKRNNYANLGCYSEITQALTAEDPNIDGIFSVKKQHDGSYEAIYLWSNSAVEATILYNLGLRIWKKITSGRGESQRVDSVLRRFRACDGIPSEENTYRIRSGMEDLPFGKDVKMITLGTSESRDLAREETGYSIASKISEVHKDMYIRHDAAFDEMHKIAKIFGLSLPSSPEDWKINSKLVNR
jgi:hypothetical protein